jgi:CRP-like cAMP-binding protein
MTLADILGYAAATLVFASFAMRTMVPLRLVGIASNVFFIAYGYMQGAVPILILHCVLLPLNVFRLQQMLALVREVETAARGDLNMDWLKPFTTRLSIRAGEALFAKGDRADAMYFVMKGSLRVPQIGVTIGPGGVVGELGLLSPKQTRTQTVEADEPTELLKITYDQVRQLYFQNPKFGFYFLQLSSRRLFENVERLERELSAYRSAPT